MLLISTTAFGVLHGGINSVLAETAASIGANLNLLMVMLLVSIYLLTI